MVMPNTALGLERIDPDTDEHRLAYETINTNAETTTALIQSDRVRLQALEDSEVSGSGEVPSSGVAGVTVGRTRMRPGVDARYAAFPAAVKLADGRLFMVWYEATDHATTRDGIIQGSISEDNGVTWGAAYTVLSVPGTDLRDPTVSISRDGQTVFLAYFKASATLAAAGFFLRRSTDGAVTFGAEVRIENQPYAAGCSPVVELENGLILATWYGKANLADARDSVWISTSPDNGTTWATPTLLVDGLAAGRDYQEPWAVSRGANVVIMFRWGNSGSIGRIASTNGGASWGTAASAFAGTGRPSSVFTSSGTLVTLFRLDPDAGQGQHGMMRYSRDFGASWSQQYVLERANPAWWLYSGPVEVAPGQIFVPTSVEATTTSAKLTTRYLTEGGGFSPFGDVPQLGGVRALTRSNTLAVADSFDRPNGPIGVSDNGIDWTAPAAVTIAEGVLQDTTSNLATGNFTIANALTAHVDIEVEVQWTTVSGIYVVYRYQNASNFWMAGVETNGVNARIYKIVAGVTTQVGTTGTVAMPAGFWHKLRVVAVGDNHKLYLEDVLVTSGTDAALNTMPWVGLRTGTSGTVTHRARNFTARRRAGLAS